MKAWQKIREITDNALPVVLQEEEQTWLYANEIEKNVDFTTKLLWQSHVPGSYAPESIMIAAVQAKENMGYLVENSESLIEKGLKVLQEDDMVLLNQITSLLWFEIHHAKKDETSSYWSYPQYFSFEQMESEVTFKTYGLGHLDETILYAKTYAGWLSQIIGGAYGTAMEGYTSQNIQATFDTVASYIRTPNTYNDDITFELAFLEAYKEKKAAITSKDIALAWIGYVPSGWSAEDIALRNIRYGLLPPESGRYQNPFSDWIGAQMRGAICGMVAYGQPAKAARLAWIDGVVSHSNNGVLGEVFNSVLVSLSYVHSDMKKILPEVLMAIPEKSEFYAMAQFAYTQCLTNKDWKTAWQACEARVKKYNWIHAYPNVMAEIIALYYGNNDFDQTLELIGLCGQDVDCNAAQIMTALGIMQGLDAIDARWKAPIGDRLDTYLRVKKVLSIKELAKETVKVMVNAK